MYKFTTALFGMVLACVSCTNDSDAELSRGRVEVSITQSTAFTRSVNFTEVQNTANYTVDIYDASGTCVKSSRLGEITGNTVELDEGSYRIVAHYGEEKAASQNVLPMKGEQTFAITDGNDTHVDVTCTPTCAKVLVNFGENMDTYFSDYYVTYTTKALEKSGTSAVWSKTNTDPWYLLVADNEVVKATIHVTRASDGKTAEIVREYQLSPAKAWTLGIKAEEPQGPVGGTATVTISVDDSTNDIESTIVVPNDWWM